MLNKERFNELFGCYKPEMQDLILRQLYDSERDFVFGLNRLEAKALRDYLEVKIKEDWLVVPDASVIPPMAKVSKKLMAGVMRERYLLEIDKATRELSKMMDIKDLSQLNIVSKHTTGELMDIYGISAYPLLQLAKKNNIFPLPDLSPNGSIRPFIDIKDANFSYYLLNPLKRANSLFGREYSGCYGNLSCLLAMDDEDILRVRNVGKTRIEEVRKIRRTAQICYPEHYRRLEELKGHARQGSYFEPGSLEDFEVFKKECELRKLINFDDEEALKRIEDYTDTELKSMFGDLYGVLKRKCESVGVYPLPECTPNGDIVPKYGLEYVEGFGAYSCEKSASDVRYAHQLFELNDAELSEWLSGLRIVSKENAAAFIERVYERYPKHVERLKEIRSKRCDQKRING